MSLWVAIWEPADRTEASANTWSAKRSSHPSLGFSLAPRKAQQRSLLSGSWSPMSCGSPWAPTRMFSSAEHSEKGVLFCFFNNTRKPDGGWLAQAKTRKISFHSSSQWLTEFLRDKEIRKICKSFSKILDHESQHLPARQPWVHCPLSSNPLPKLLCSHRHILQPECLEHSTGPAKPLREKKSAQLFPF